MPRNFWTHLLAFMIGVLGSIIIIGTFSLNLCKLFDTCTPVSALLDAQKRIEILDTNLSNIHQCTQKQADRLASSLKQQKKFRDQINKKIEESHERMRKVTTKMEKVIEQARLLVEISPILTHYIAQQ